MMGFFALFWPKKPELVLSKHGQEMIEVIVSVHLPNMKYIPTGQNETVSEVIKYKWDWLWGIKRPEMVPSKFGNGMVEVVVTVNVPNMRYILTGPNQCLSEILAYKWENLWAPTVTKGENDTETDTDIVSLVIDTDTETDPTDVTPPVNHTNMLQSFLNDLALIHFREREGRAWVENVQTDQWDEYDQNELYTRVSAALMDILEPTEKKRKKKKARVKNKGVPNGDVSDWLATNCDHPIGETDQAENNNHFISFDEIRERDRDRLERMGQIVSDYADYYINRILELKWGHKKEQNKTNVYPIHTDQLKAVTHTDIVPAEPNICTHTTEQSDCYLLDDDEYIDTDLSDTSETEYGWNYLNRHFNRFLINELIETAVSVF